MCEAISPYFFIVCKYSILHCQLTFKLECELIWIVEGEHLLVRCLIICIEDNLGGEHKYWKASFHQLRLSMLLLHWLQLSSCPSSVHSLPQTPHPFINKPLSCVCSVLVKIMLQHSSPQGHDMVLKRRGIRITCVYTNYTSIEDIILFYLYSHGEKNYSIYASYVSMAFFTVAL